MIILELEAPIILQDIFVFLIFFIGGGSLPIFLNVVMEFPNRSSLTISSRLIKRVLKVFLKIIPILYLISLLNPFKNLELIQDGLFLGAFNVGPITLSCTQIGK